MQKSFAVGVALAPDTAARPATAAKRRSTVHGQPGFEKWDSRSKSGELNILVDRRFLVSFEGSDLDGTTVHHEMAGRMDFSRFASLE